MLKEKALSAVLWSAGDILLRQGLQFGVSVMLARLLAPEEFGTVALLYLFTGIATVLADSGLGVALIQGRDLSHVDESTVFWFNLVLGALAASSLCLAAPAIANFYGRAVLVPITQAMALNLFVNSLGSVHNSLLSKRLDFRTQMKIGAYATLLSGEIAVAMAWRGYGVWSLVAQSLAATSTTTLLLWSLNPWRPALSFSTASARRLLGFGGYMMFATLIDITYSRGYTALIGKVFGAADLGFYNRAENTKQLPVGIVSSIFMRVAFPVFSQAAHEPDNLRLGVQMAIRGIMFLNAPIMIGIAAVAEPLVLTLFGPRWLPAAPILQVLCLGGVLWPLHLINVNVLMAQGYSHLLFRIELLKKSIGIPLLLGGCLFGVMGIAWSQVIFSALTLVINAHFTKRFLNYGTLAQLRDFMPVLLISIAMGFEIYFSKMHQPFHFHAALELLALTSLGAVFFLASAALFRLRAIKDISAMLHRRNSANSKTQSS